MDEKLNQDGSQRKNPTSEVESERELVDLVSLGSSKEKKI